MSNYFSTPVICFGQQPCGFLPKRFLWAKIITARRLKKETGGRIVFFFHDSDHDPRETQTLLQERNSGVQHRLNFEFLNKIQKEFSPLYLKHIPSSWQQSMARQLPKYLDKSLVHIFQDIKADTAADFCLQMYERLGLLEGIDVIRSSDPEVRRAACRIDDYFVDTDYRNERVRARYFPEWGLRLHKGGNSFIDLPDQSWEKDQVSPARDTRLRWMQSVIQCTHYIAGAGEMQYLDCNETPEITFLPREQIENTNAAYIP